MQVLIVDDDDFALSVLDATLARMGYGVVVAHDGAEAMQILRAGDIRLVITDWDMPEMNGVDLCRTVRKEDLPGYVYIIMLTGREGAKQRMEGLCAGADDFLNKPLDPEELLVCLKTAERILSLETRDLALFALAKLVESRDSETGAHIERVQGYSKLVAQNLSPEVKACHGVDEEYIRLLRQTSALHDLGKIAVPDSILLKPGKLTTDEMAIMQTHTILGSQTLDAALQRFPNARFLQMAGEIAATHHEKFNGSGYPRGLAAEQIPLCGRIVAIADVYDALTSRRVYKEAMSHEQAVEIIKRERGAHFDPEVVDAFMRVEKQIVAIRERLRNESKPNSEPAAPLPATTEGQCGRHPRKILVVEDDPIMRAMLVKLLSATGEPVIEATDGREAMNVFIEQRPRIIVSDWMMPRMDGVAFCKEVRLRDSEGQSHFIMLTANGEKNQLLEAYEAGVDDFISKPFDPEELMARLRAGIRATRLRDEMMNKATGSEALSAKLAIINSKLERLSITDDLTGLFNRRQAKVKLDEQWALTSRFVKPLSLALLDLDHFKRINDTLGHEAGDIVLQRVAAILRDQVRGTDVLCRFGGEEFLILFPLQTVQESRICAERCRCAIENMPIHVHGQTLRVTISVGMATRTRDMKGPCDLIRTADQALYIAKGNGRNLVHLADSDGQLGVSNDPVVMVPAPAAPSTPPAPSTQPAPAISAPLFDRAAVVKRCGGDPSFASAVIQRFRTSVGGEVTKIQQALRGGDAPGLQRVAHSLKSMAAYIAADRASELAKQLEAMGKANDLASVEPVLAQLGAEIEQINRWIEQSETAPATV
jgi:putative two-component system response regulator